MWRNVHLSGARHICWHHVWCIHICGGGHDHIGHKRPLGRGRLATTWCYTANASSICAVLKAIYPQIQQWLQNPLWHAVHKPLSNHGDLIQQFHNIATCMYDCRPLYANTATMIANWQDLGGFTWDHNIAMHAPPIRAGRGSRKQGHPRALCWKASDCALLQALCCK